MRNATQRQPHRRIVVGLPRLEGGMYEIFACEQQHRERQKCRLPLTQYEAGGPGVAVQFRGAEGGRSPASADSNKPFVTCTNAHRHNLYATPQRKAAPAIATHEPRNSLKRPIAERGKKDCIKKPFVKYFLCSRERNLASCCCGGHT